MALEQLITLVNCKAEVYEALVRLRPRGYLGLEHHVLRFEISMTNFAFVHVHKRQKELVDNSGSFWLVNSAFLLDFALQLSTLIQWHNQMQCLLKRAEICFDNVHDQRMVQFAQNVVLSLHVVFVAWL